MSNPSLEPDKIAPAWEQYEYHLRHCIGMNDAEVAHVKMGFAAGAAWCLDAMDRAVKRTEPDDQVTSGKVN